MSTDTLCPENIRHKLYVNGFILHVVTGNAHFAVANYASILKDLTLN